MKIFILVSLFLASFSAQASVNIEKLYCLNYDHVGYIVTARSSGGYTVTYQDRNGRERTRVLSTESASDRLILTVERSYLNADVAAYRLTLVERANGIFLFEKMLHSNMGGLLKNVACEVE